MNPQPFADIINSNFFIDQIKDYAVFIMDVQGHVATWNLGAERLKGYKEEEIIGQYYGVLFPDAYQESGLPKQETDIAFAKGTYETEDWRKRKDGSIFWAKVTLTSIYSEKGEHIGFTKVTSDFTYNKELQDKLAERNEALVAKNQELQRINLDLDNFIYTASHDLRSPISNIEGLMTILKNELEETSCFSDDTEEVLHRVITSINRFKNTIEDLTEISRLHKNVTEKQSEEIINVKQIYEDIRADLCHPLSNIEFFIQTDFQVHQLKFSKKNFRSILFNLINNAIKYQSPERSCVVQVHTRLEEPYVVLSVKDNGLGMNIRHQEQLFTMFKRFHNHVEGSGIGLFMVKRIIENADGKIEVESEEGSGTEVKVYLKSAL